MARISARHSRTAQSVITWKPGTRVVEVGHRLILQLHPQVLRLTEQVLRVMSPGPVRHGIQPQPLGGRSSYHSILSVKKPRTYQERSSAAVRLMISLRWHDPHQVKGQDLAGLLSAAPAGSPFSRLSSYAFFPGNASKTACWANLYTRYCLTNSRGRCHNKCDKNRGAHGLRGSGPLRPFT